MVLVNEDILTYLLTYLHTYLLAYSLTCFLKLVTSCAAKSRRDEEKRMLESDSAVKKKIR